MAKQLTNGKEEEIIRIERDRQELNEAYSDKPESINRRTERSAEDAELLQNLEDRVDRYNFVHNHKLPSNLSALEIKKNQIELSREKKWLKMMFEWSRIYVPAKNKYSEKLVSRIYKGIPDKIRHRAWQKLLEVENQVKAQSGVYEKMKKFALQYSLELRQIDLDINRTFRNNMAYRIRYGPRQRQLYNILAAYSVYNSEIGYCQGMSTLTAMLLLYIAKEEETFWALSQLMSNIRYSMHGLFKSGFPKLIRFSDKHEMIIKTFLPNVHAKFLKCNITPLIYTTKWFLQCYVDALPFSLVLRVWDVYLLKGDIAILAMSYCILKMHKRTLLQKDFDMDKINEFINHKLPENFMFDDDEVIKKLEKCIEKLQRHRFESGPLLDLIPPPAETPSMPFGDLAKLSQQELIAQIQLYHKQKGESNREVQIEQIASERLQEAKKIRADEKKRRQQQQQILSANGPVARGGEHDKNNNYMNEKNLSDSENDQDDDSDEESNQLRVDSSDDEENGEFERRRRAKKVGADGVSDDLNPSRISEYDEDKESVLSSMTNDDSSPMHGNRSNNSSKHASSLSPKKHSPNKSDQMASDYENLNENSTSSFGMDSVNGRPKNDESKPGARSQSTLNSPARNTIPTSKSYYIPTTASIMSNPPPSSGSATISPRSTSNHSTGVTSIRTNPAYYSSPYYGTHFSSSKDSSKIINTRQNSSEYVRTPHGIYTRTSVLPSSTSVTANLGGGSSSPAYSASTRVNGSSNHSHLPQSTSSVLISNSGIYTRVGKGSVHIDSSHFHVNNGSKQRVGSLRSVQNGHPNNHNGYFYRAGSGTGSSNVAATALHQFDQLNSKINNSIYVTPSTKQLLQNHSFRIATIQQRNNQDHGPSTESITTSPSQQNGTASNSATAATASTYYMISQAPPKTTSLEQNFSRSVSVKANPTAAHTTTHIEQYDFI